LAREPRCKYVDIALVFFRGTGLDETVNVSKDGGFMEEPVLDPLREDLLAELVKLYIPHCLPAQQMLMSKIAAANPGEQGKMPHSQKDQNGSR
tara:strand:- start:356 stop:634 length:279 start_codon:yes stop_codon:yes gene_type:complete